MSKMKMEISVTTGLVLMMVVLMVLIQMVVPESLRSTGFILSILLFMILMGAAGIKLMDVKQ
jgi:hypothetical protein